MQYATERERTRQQLATVCCESNGSPVGNLHKLSREAQVICVDLDNTLLRTDLLVENIIAILRHNPFLVFLFPIWLLRGKAAFKAELARRFPITPDLLPYNDAVVRMLESRAEEGFRLWLVTASNIDL